MSCVIARSSRCILVWAFQTLPEVSSQGSARGIYYSVVEIIIFMLNLSFPSPKVFSKCFIPNLHQILSSSECSPFDNTNMSFVLKRQECSTVHFSTKSHRAHIARVGMSKDSSCQLFTPNNVDFFKGSYGCAVLLFGKNCDENGSN